MKAHHVPGAPNEHGRPPGPPRRPLDADGGLGLDGPRDLGEVRRFSHEAMHTVFEVYAVHPDQDYAAQAAQAAFDLVDRLEQELSRFIPNSDVGRINHLAAGEHTQVSPTTLECLVISRHVYELTGGAFDISIGTGLASLAFDADRFLVRATKDGVRIDLGAIGKGYAVDLAAELLEEWDVRAALVHGGFSSVLALEPPPGRDGWPLTLSDPGSPSRVLARLSVRRTAIAASGLRKGDHIIDPRRGTPVRGRLAAWAAVPRPDAASGAPDGPRLAAGAVTDALTTAFMMVGHDEIAALCRRSPGLEAWILEDPGDASSTRRAEALPHADSEVHHADRRADDAEALPHGDASPADTLARIVHFGGPAG
jgi:thiamine biosynthesis lipoprotein